MYVLVKDKNVAKYPYSISELKQDNPNVSFPFNISDEILSEYGVFSVEPSDYPAVDKTKNVTEKNPEYIKGVWKQVFSITDATADEIQERTNQELAKNEALRLQAYRDESDPLFFKWQRGEATQQQWLDKINEIKQRY